MTSTDDVPAGPATDTGPARLEHLVRNAVVENLVGPSPVTVVDVRWFGPDSMRVFFTHPDGRTGDTIAYRDHEARLRVTAQAATKPFDADAADFTLAAEALRIRNAARFDPMLAVSSSDVEPLPHQLRAVYGELLPRTPLRFLLADDPGAGKTVMAGLYIKELMLRADLARCLVVAPGSLVEQWRDELADKFGLAFDVLTRSMLEADPATVFERNPLLIARMDQLSRSEEFLAALETSDWDLVVVDEAHRMSAHYYGAELKRTRRYQLGELLGRIARHLLLMTATPHAGKDEDFQLFLALLDADRFEGRVREGSRMADTSGLMRRMVKEDLLTFEGRPLFPERRASTVPYNLSDDEARLYEAVTQYVREEMNRADQVGEDGDKRRTTTVGFALTVLQRRLASSPEAIWRSLERRRRRLERRRQEMTSIAVGGDESLERRLARLLGADPAAWQEAIDAELDDLDADQSEELAEEVVDAATAARTVAELDTEIRVLTGLETLARQVRHSDTDRKWTELRSLLTGAEVRAPDGSLRKLIVFTEHRDTLTYLVDKVRRLVGRDDAVESIHGGVRREQRRAITERFTSDGDLAVLVATDAAGEGLNLQRAHLMVNYDLPWNPNRIEQRFGRIHRIGQTEVCHLWNLVAVDTREGMVFQRLLDKVEEQRRAYSGRVFDVLGEAFEERPLRDLLLEAIRYGDDPQRQADLNRVIDSQVGAGIDALLAERALHRHPGAVLDVSEMRLQLEQAKARRLQPHFVSAFFGEAFRRLGGRMVAREPGRFEVTHVPALLRERDRHIGTGAPVLPAYERITFERTLMRTPGAAPAALLAPGHPLLDVTIDIVIERFGTALRHGAVLVDTLDPGLVPHLSVAITSEVVDGDPRQRVISRRFSFVDITPDGATSEAGPAPYLDHSAPDTDDPLVAEVIAQQVAAEWLRPGVEDLAMDWAVGLGGREHLREVEAMVVAEVGHTRTQVLQRLEGEINYWDVRALDLTDRVAQGKHVSVTPQTASRRARDLEGRLEARLAQLAQQADLRLRPPQVATAALVLPQGMFDTVRGQVDGESALAHARETERVERRAVDAVLAAEFALGRMPHEKPHNHPGYDVLSLSEGDAVTIEVKGRILGADDVIVTKTEVLVGKTKGEHHRLALVAVHPDGPHHDEVRYLVDPFRDQPDPGFYTDKVVLNWRKLWADAGVPR